MSRDSYAQGVKLAAAGRQLQAIEAFERALAQRPDDTRTLFALGNTARALGLKGAAQEFYRRVLALEPERLEALVNLANLLRSEGQFAAAEALLTPALARHPEAPELWLTLGSVYRETGDAERARAHYQAALARQPDFAAALVNLADILADEGDYAEAAALYDRALRQEPDNAQARLNRAILHFLRGELEDGWRDYAARLELPGKAPHTDHGLKSWDGSPLPNGTLLVTAEQGVGDQIMFASMIPELTARAAAEAGRIILECEPRLVALFARSFPDAAVHAAEIENREGKIRARYDWLKAAGGAQAAVEMGALPRFLRRRLERFPAPHVYLKPDAAEQQSWRAAFADYPRPLTGICWRSGKTGGGRAVQYAPLEAWASFIRELPGTAVAAQYDATPEEIGALSVRSGRVIAVPQGIDQKRELDRAAALFSILDAVVGAPTAVSWLAAAAGVATYKVLYDTSWTSFGRAYEPFAPAAVCLMPKRPGDWADVFAQAMNRISRPTAPA